MGSARRCAGHSRAVPGYARPHARLRPAPQRSSGAARSRLRAPARPAPGQARSREPRRDKPRGPGAIRTARLFSGSWILISGQDFHLFGNGSGQARIPALHRSVGIRRTDLVSINTAGSHAPESGTTKADTNKEERVHGKHERHGKEHLFPFRVFSCLPWTREEESSC